MDLEREALEAIKRHANLELERGALKAMDRYQKEARLMQLQGLAQMAVNREEAQRCLAEAALLRATTDC